MPLFSVPKFIERESPIVGPLTFKQFIFILCTVAIGFIIYRTFPFFLSLPLLVILGALGFSLAFLKIGEIPFYKILLEGLTFFFRPKRLYWGKKKREVSIVSERMELKKEEKVPLKIKRGGKLKETTIQIETKK
jgi:hypothetical protein